MPYIQGFTLVHTGHPKLLIYNLLRSNDSCKVTKSQDFIPHTYLQVQRASLYELLQRMHLYRDGAFLLLWTSPSLLGQCMLLENIKLISSTICNYQLLNFKFSLLLHLMRPLRSSRSTSYKLKLFFA